MIRTLMPMTARALATPSVVPMAEHLCVAPTAAFQGTALPVTGWSAVREREGYLQGRTQRPVGVDESVVRPTSAPTNLTHDPRTVAFGGTPGPRTWSPPV